MSFLRVFIRTLNLFLKRPLFIKVYNEYFYIPNTYNLIFLIPKLILNTLTLLSTSGVNHFSSTEVDP